VKEDDVPQYAGSAYGGHKKLLYAVDDAGNYKAVESVGCEIEAHATYDAVAELRSRATEAWQRARRGDASPLEYHMYQRRMDVALLAQTAGFFRWRVRRHLAVSRFAALPESVLRRYADALGIDMAALRRLPDEP